MFVACHTLCEIIQTNSLDHIQLSLAYQVAQAIADMHDVEDDGYASIAHSKYYFLVHCVSFKLII